MLTKIPVLARWAAAKRFAREILKVVEAAPSGSRYGLHLCLGDLNNESMGRPVDAGPLVALANALMAAWPAGSDSRIPACPACPRVRNPDDGPGLLRTVVELWLPDHVRFIGGFIHERSTIKNLIQIRDQIEFNLGRQIDVGRLMRPRPPAAARPPTQPGHRESGGPAE